MSSLLLCQMQLPSCMLRALLRPFVHKLYIAQRFVFRRFWLLLFWVDSDLYSISKWKRQSISLFFSNEKFKKQILFFYLHFTWLCGSWKPQRILKKYWFWKCESWFPFEVAKLTSANYPLKWCIFSHDFYHFNQYFLI